MKSFSHYLIKVCCVCVLLFGCSSKDIAPEPIVVSIPDEGVSGDTSDDTSTANYSILFIGNSLTYTNDLPNLVLERASQDGITIETTMVAYANYGLEDHWNDGKIQTMIETFKYDFVVIQQGPSSQAYGRSSLIEFGGLMKEVCDANGAKLAYFMVWPSLLYYHTFPGVIQNYTDAANLNNALLCPVGVHWRAVNQNDDYTYYGPDGFHPSVAGSEAAANVILESLGIL